MATLITVGNSEGERRCDAKCYNATQPECDCCCGGRNHGKGLDGAQQATADHANEIISAIKGSDPTAFIEFHPTQGELF